MSAPRDAPGSRQRPRKIGDVARELGVSPHVLRYWESEVPELAPRKTRGAHRLYRPEDVALCRRLRALIREEGLTLAAARRRLAAEGAPSEGRPGATERPGRPGAPSPPQGPERTTLIALRQRLVGLLDELEAMGPGDPAEGPNPVVLVQPLLGGAAPEGLVSKSARR